MSAVLQTVTDVHRTLQERIASGVYPVGSKLPSCRALALELSSNPSTVDRAIGRLVDSGLVRTLPRRGSFVTATPGIAQVTAESLRDDLRLLLARARSAGLSVEQVQQIVDDAMGGRTTPRVVVLECNPRDLERLSRLIRNSTGLDVTALHLDDIGGRRLDEEFDVVAVPLFHLHDLTGAVRSLASVVEINVAASPVVLRRLATLGDDRKVVVAASTERGLDRMSAIVRQYHPGPVTTFHIGADDPTEVIGADTVVRNNAGDLPEEIAALVGEVLVIEWELEAGFASAFLARVEAVMAG